LLVRAEAGLRMGALAAAGPGHFFAPAPTEPAATVGGVIACEARGVFAGRYGGVREHVLGVESLRSAAGRDVIASAVLRLLPKPRTLWGVAFLFSDEAAAGDFSREAALLAPVAVNEYLDAGTLRALTALRRSAGRLQALPETGAAAARVYV
ncbi:MAG: hypothetical protein Q4C13_03800, partial [Clostridia bacterium]|nr:hypothetical protein [Clostridia bacterium]